MGTRRSVALFVFGAVTCAAAALSKSAAGAVIHVPQDQPTINNAISAASNGDTVLVGPGTYNTSVFFAGKTLTLQSTGGADATIIDATGISGGTPGIYVPNTTAPGAIVIEGFTIKGGDGFNSPGTITTIRGGGVYVVNADVEIRDCKIIDNQISAGVVIQGIFNVYGGGVHQDKGTLLMRNCLVANNKVITTSLPQSIGSAFSAGGGVSVSNTSSGGTVATATLIDCTITGNQSTSMDGASAGGVLAGGPMTLINCVIRGNFATDTGGGLQTYPSNPVTLTNCRVTGNSVSDTGTKPAINGGSGLVLHACTVANNTTANSGVIAVTGAVTMDNCIVYGNSGTAFDGTAAVQYSCVQGGYPGTGNISGDPLLLNPGSGDYRLADASPCRDVGDRTLLPADAFDLDGDLNTTETLSRDLGLLRRVVNGQVDMGAHEWQRPCAADISPSSPGVAGDGEIDIDDLFVVINGWGSCDQCVADVNGDDQVDVDDLFDVINAWGDCR